MSEPRAGRPRRGEPVAIGEATANGLRMVFHRWAGPAVPASPPVVVLHGVLQTGEGMANLAAHLARRAPVLAPDLRGRGGTEQPADGYDPATMADDVAALIEAVGFAQPVVIGRLHGGVVAYHLAARHPGLVRGLVLGDVAPEVGPERAERALVRMRALPRRFASLADAERFYQEVLNLSEARARHDIPYDLVPDGDGFAWRHNLDLVERIEAASAPRADWDLLAAIDCPMLLLRGQHGGVTPEMAARLREVRPETRVQTVIGARQDVFLGPGAEQAFGAIDVFLLGLGDGRARPEAAVPPDDAVAEPAADVAATLSVGAAGIVERLVRAINGRDDQAVVALVTPGAQIRQHLPDGGVRAGGVETFREAFEAIFTTYPNAAVAATHLVDGGERVACVLDVREEAGSGRVLAVAPMFLMVAEGRIAEMATYAVRVEAG